MKINIKNIAINYIQYGNGTKDIILLHGWGQNIAMMKPLGDALSNKFRITILDLPGFGESSEPKSAWTIYDYSDLIKELVGKLKIKKPIIIGHSFGGRVAISYAANNDVEKLVLFGSPCIRHEQKTSLKTKILKTLKKMPGINSLSEIAKKHIGSRDYKAASPMMRQVLVNVINQDLSEEAKRIEEPTLLIWGNLDEEAPLEDAKELEKIMSDAGLIVLNGTHYAYLENLNQIISILNEFL